MASPVAILATIPADRERKDLERLGMGNGRHGFVFVIPERIKDGYPHAIGARIVGETALLGRSPRRLDCPTPR
jgi:hypothetical protein